MSISCLIMSDQLMDLSSSSNSLLLKMRQFLRENFAFFLVEISKSPVISRILNCRRWSEMEDEMLPPLEQQERSLVKMLSIRVAELFVRREGCNIRGLNP